MKFLNFALTKVAFNLNREFAPKADQEMVVAPEVAINHEIRTDTRQLIVLMGVRQISGDLPYYFEIESAALFEFDAMPEEKILKQFFTINCPAIMFPYIRETIADLTRRAGFQPLHLNPVNFIQLAKDHEIKKEPVQN